MHRSRNHYALALAFGLHLLAGLLWWQETRPHPAGEPRVVTRFLRLADRPPPPAAQPTPPADLRPRRASSASAPPSHAPLRAEAQVPIEPAPSPAEDAPAPAPGASFDVDLLKRQGARVAGAVARELPAPRPDPNARWTRFRDHLEAAHVGGAGVWQDSYTAPDGTIIYRKHVGDATICRMSGSVSVLGMSNMKGVNDAGGVPCPQGVTWRHEP